MKHPILSRFGLIIYTLVWAVFILIHGAVVYFFLEQPLAVAILDSLVYNLVFALLAVGLWYVVVYARLNRDETAIFVTHIVAALITVLLWSTIADGLMQMGLRAIGLERHGIEENFWRWIIGMMYYSIIALIFYLIRYYQDVQQKAQREAELQTLLKDAELNMLKSQINPHFIFNSLNSISALTVAAPTQAQTMVIKLSEFLRYSLGKESKEMNSLQEEINNISLYLDIEKVRFGDRLEFSTNLDKRCLAIEVPNLLLQPLVENAIKYGVYDSLGKVLIQLNCEFEDNLLVVKISNTMDTSSVQSKGEGIGLKNVGNRLRLVYGRSDLLETRQEEDQFTAILRIPIDPGKS